MFRKTLSAALGVASLPCVLVAEPLVLINRTIPLYITASATVRQDDNVFLTRDNTESDTIFVFAPGLDARFTGAETSMAVTFEEQLVYYRDNTQLDSSLTSFNGSISQELPRSGWSLITAYTELDQSNFDARTINQSVRRNVTDVAASVDWNVTAKTSVGTGVAFQQTEYPNSNNVDSDLWTVPLDWYYAISPKVDLSAGYQYRRNLLEQEGSDSKDRFVNVGARGRFTSKLEGQFRVGYTQREPERGASSSLFGLSSRLTYAATPKSTFEFSASNDFDNAASGASQKTLRFSVTGSYALTPEWSASSEVSFESSEEIGASGRTDEFWVGSIGTSYAFSLNTSVYISYLYRTNDSNIGVVNFENNVVSVSASVRF